MSEQYYAIGDIHGRYDLLQKALEFIHSRQDTGKIIFLGDYIDRGPQSKEVVQHLMQGPLPGWDYVCLKGNHEDMFWYDMLNQNEPYDKKVANSMDATELGDALDWFASLPLYHIVENNIFVHADWDETKPPEQQTEARMLWTRRNEDFHSYFYVTHGHTPYRNGPVFFFHRCNLDTMAFETGKLSIGVFEIGTIGPTEIYIATPHTVYKKG